MKSSLLAGLIIRSNKLTPFEKQVLLKTLEIKRGSTITYGKLAELVGRKGASRAVGNALNKNPYPLLIPCHRVVGSKSIGGYKYGPFAKKLLLAAEKLFH